MKDKNKLSVLLFLKKYKIKIANLCIFYEIENELFIILNFFFKFPLKSFKEPLNNIVPVINLNKILHIVLLKVANSGLKTNLL